MRQLTTTPDLRARQRFDNLAWHVVYHARSPAESVAIEKLIAAVAVGVVRLRDGHAVLQQLRRDQQRDKDQQPPRGGT